MDIQITGVEDPDDGFLYVARTIDGGAVPHLNKMPRDMLAIRAAEYNLAPDDPKAMDIMLMEPFIVLEKPQPYHPLHTCDTIDEALEIVWAQVEDAKTRDDAPKDPILRSLFRAADLPVPESTQGLTDVKERLLNYCDDKAPIWVTVHRDENRAHVKKQLASGFRPYNLLDQLKQHALGTLHDQASVEQRRRSSTRVRWE
jgi:hypothetical protein